MTESKLQTLTLVALEDMKAETTRVLDVSAMTSIADLMVVTSGRSTRHVKSIADHVVEQAKKAGFDVIGVEGKESAEWVLVDLGDIIVHVMLPQTREFYSLEKLWTIERSSRVAR